MSKVKSTNDKKKMTKKVYGGEDGENTSLKFEDILYEKKDRVARVTINRPDMRNALRSTTREELAIAIEDAWVDDDIGVIVVTALGLQTPRKR